MCSELFKLLLRQFYNFLLVRPDAVAGLNGKCLALSASLAIACPFDFALSLPFSPDMFILPSVDLLINHSMTYYNTRVLHLFSEDV